MKKQEITLLLFIFTFSFCSFGQVFLEEDFSNSQMPPDGWSISDNSINWSTQFSYQAGGMAPEARLNWWPTVFYDDTYLISPEFDLTGVNAMRLEFKHKHNYIENSEDYSIGVATRSGGTTNWNSVWEISPEGNTDPKIIALIIDNDDVGEPDFQFSFYHEGPIAYDCAWYIDNIIFYKALDHDLAVIDIQGNNQFNQEDLFSPVAYIQNKGSYVESFEVVFNITDHNNILLYTESQQVNNLAINEELWLTFDSFLFEDWDALYNFSVETILENDDDPSNNVFIKHLNTYTAERELVLFEIGTYNG